MCVCVRISVINFVRRQRRKIFLTHVARDKFKTEHHCTRPINKFYANSIIFIQSTYTIYLEKISVINFVSHSFCMQPFFYKVAL